MKKRLPSDDAILRFIGGEFAAYRRERGLTQEDLAEISRMTADRVGTIERGHRDFGMLAISDLYICLECGGVIVDAKGCAPLRDRITGARIQRETATIHGPSMLGGMGKAVRDSRKAQKLSLARLAEEASIHLNSLWYFEKGLIVPGICSYYRILRSLGIDRVTVENGNAVFHNK